MAARLLEWYRANRRDLPWRRTRDPYAIWVSEIMLQQTQVDQVIPYYERFMKAFPTVADLAAAPLDAAMKVWEGMGYYSRVRHMQRAAQQIVSAHGGRFPETYADVRALPGLGEYAAGSVLSIAFNQPYPAVDGNVLRVFARVLRLESDPKKAAARRQVTEAVASMIPDGEARDFTQALMELGALVCRPHPACAACCWAEDCRAYNELPDPAALPVRSPKKARPHYEIAVGIVWKGDRVLIARRAPEGLLGGLWEFPGGKREPGESLEDCCRREVGEEMGIEVDVVTPFRTVEHGYSHFSITLHAFHCRHRAGEPAPRSATECRWATVGELSDYAFPKANKVLIEALQKSLQPDTQRKLFHP